MTVTKEELIAECTADITQAKEELVKVMSKGALGGKIDKDRVYTQLQKIVVTEIMKKYAEDSL
jgi:N-acetylglutamate synthase/N-acetylornithine aminotransferase|tara:strand:- start:693 stop:881 length:189 start_codon:yes stop_codon:yes gene_type:complete